METSIAGILTVLFVFYLFVKKKIFLEELVFWCLIFETFVELGIVVRIGSSEMGPARFLEHILALYCLIQVRMIPANICRSWLLLILSYILPPVILFFFPTQLAGGFGEITWDSILQAGEDPVRPSVNGDVIKMTLRLILYSFIIVCIYVNYSKEMYLRLLSRTANICKILLILGLIEFVCRNFLGLNDFVETAKTAFFGDTKFTFHGRLRGSLYELQLFMKETSHYAYTLFLTALILLANNKIFKKKLIDKYLYLCLFLIAVSTSFSGIMFVVACIGILLLIRWSVLPRKKRNIEVTILVSSLFIFISSAFVLLNYFSDSLFGERLFLIYENFGNLVAIDWSRDNPMAYQDGSSVIRIISVTQTLVAFFSRPIFGYSLNTFVCHGSTAMYLANVGVFGVLIFVWFFFYIFPFKRMMAPRKGFYSVAILIYFLVNLLNSYLLAPFMGLIPLMIALCFSCYFSESLQKEFKFK